MFAPGATEVASPQTEEGWVQVARELYRAIQAAGLGRYESLVLGVVVDQCYGPRKVDSAKFSAAELARETGLNKSNLHRAAGSLVASNILKRTPDGGLAVQKDYEAWIRDGLPILSPALVEFAQKSKRVPKTRKQKPVVTRDNRRLSPETTLAPAPYMSLSEDSGETDDDDDDLRGRGHDRIPHVDAPPSIADATRTGVDDRVDGLSCVDGFGVRTPDPDRPAARPVVPRTVAELTAWLRVAYPADAPALEPTLEAHAATYPVEWIHDAIQATGSRDVESKTSYVETILRAWKADPGSRTATKPRSRAAASARKESPRVPDAVINPELSKFYASRIEKRRAKAKEDAK